MSSLSQIDQTTLHWAGKIGALTATTAIQALQFGQSMVSKIRQFKRMLTTVCISFIKIDLFCEFLRLGLQLQLLKF